MGFHSIPLVGFFDPLVCACVHMGKYLCVYKCMCLYYVSKNKGLQARVVLILI
jgi:hypothetical protein